MPQIIQSPFSSSSNSLKCSAFSGSEIVCSPPNHLPRSIILQRCEQNGPYFPANQSPFFLQVGQMTFVPRRSFMTGHVIPLRWLERNVILQDPHALIQHRVRKPNVGGGV